MKRTPAFPGGRSCFAGTKASARDAIQVENFSDSRAQPRRLRRKSDLLLWRKYTRGLLLFVCVAAYARNVRGQAGASTSAAPDPKAPMPIYIEEFFLSDAVRNEDKGELQLTLGVDSRRGLGTSTVLQTEYGLTNRLQLNFEFPYGFTAGEDSEIPASWSAASVGLQYQVLRSNSPFALSVGMAIGVPVKPNSQLEYEPTILAAKTFHKLQMHASFLTDVEQWKPSLQYNVASVYPVRDRWFPTLEFNGRRLDGRNAWYITPGIYRHLPHRIELGLGVPLGLGGVAAPVGVVAKVNWELGGAVDRD